MRFFDDPDMDFATRCVLSGVRHGMAEVGETLTTIAHVVDGDAASWLDAFVALGRRLRREADRAAARGHTFSAWNAALRSANYLYAGLWWAPATPAAPDEPALWEEHMGSWDLAVTHWPSPVELVGLAHDGTTLAGWWFTSPAATTEPAPAVVLVQGLGTPISDICMTGLDGALARGHHVLVFDGPGQGRTLRERGRTLDDTWPTAIRTALEWTAGRAEVDASRVSLIGVGAGALFAPELPLAPPHRPPSCSIRASSIWVRTLRLLWDPRPTTGPGGCSPGRRPGPPAHPTWPRPSRSWPRTPWMRRPSARSAARRWS